MNFAISSCGSSTSSYQATGVRKSRGGSPAHSIRAGKVRQPEIGTEVFADISARHRRAARRESAHRAESRRSPAVRHRSRQLGHETLAALLRHDQQLAVGVVKRALGHRAIRRVQMHARAGLRVRIAIARHRDQAFDKVGGLGWNRQRVPAQLIRRSLDLAEVAR